MLSVREQAIQKTQYSTTTKHNMQVILPPATPDLAVLSSISFGSITTSTSSSAYYAIETILGISEEEGIHVIKLHTNIKMAHLWHNSYSCC